ncbi:5'-methylthioadenosine/S-adenosylhomocysteine nucleosidase [Buchnera aphidicola (Eriosoma lanigerum)]|uniref:5'-methylthioadenosine/adenosylhomocysteine nucleosidase n=1 Tax=Buchnera aphidicola TaxID=9 RepID=UPI003463B65D
MKIAVIGAIDEEIQFFKNSMDKKTIEHHNTYQFYIGSLFQFQIILLKSGIGKVLASIATTLLIKVYNPDIIINIGSAGSIHNLLQPGNIVIPNLISYHDVNLTKFGYKIGQIPGFPQSFSVNKKLLKIYRKVVLEHNIKYMEGNIVTGDNFIFQKKNTIYIKKHFINAIAVDMESAAIAHVCYKFNIAFLVIRSISDYANKNGDIDFKKFITLSSINNLNIFQSILKHLK